MFPFYIMREMIQPKGMAMKIAVLEPLGVTNEDLASRIYAACYAYDGELEI